MDIPQLFSDQGVYIQELSYTCGPCAILNLLHLKGDVSHDEIELAELCDAKPEIGTSNKNLVSACMQVGLEVLENKQNASLADVERNIDKGVFVIVNYFDAFAGEGHYSVVTAHDDRAIYLVDSSLGLLRLDKQDFVKHWHNSRQTIFAWYAAIAS